MKDDLLNKLQNKYYIIYFFSKGLNKKIYVHYMGAIAAFKTEKQARMHAKWLGWKNAEFELVKYNPKEHIIRNDIGWKNDR